MIVIKICNTVGCSTTATKFNINTEESQPIGMIYLEAQAAGANQINLKWYPDPLVGFAANGAILYSVLVEGPFLMSAINSTEKISFKRLNKPFVEIALRNLLNTTISNTIYGILDGILAYSNYNIQVNASNSQGFLLSNRVKLETFKSGPSELIVPQFVASTSNTIRIEWFEPILVNSNDQTIFYKV